MSRRVLKDSNLINSIRVKFEEKKDDHLKSKLKKIDWTPVRDRDGNIINEGDYTKNYLMMGPKVNSTGAPVHIGVYEDRMVVVKIVDKVATSIAYGNPLMRNEFRIASEIESMAPVISTPHIALAAPYPKKTTKTSRNMMIIEYRLCSLGDFIKELSKESSEQVKWNILKKISAMGFDLLDQLITKTAYVHRDIKPDNILVTFTPGGDFKLELTDFGVAVQSGMLQIYPVGTPFYSAREQQNPKKEDRRVTWLWDMEGWVLSVVGMAADLGLIPRPAFMVEDLKAKEYYMLKVEFFKNIPEIGILKPLVAEVDRIISENPPLNIASWEYSKLKGVVLESK